VAPNPEMLMFGDEAAKDERTLIRQHGRSRVGTRYVTSINELLLLLSIQDVFRGSASYEVHATQFCPSSCSMESSHMISLKDL
jgi:hypothetical protein